MRIFVGTEYKSTLVRFLAIISAIMVPHTARAIIGADPDISNSYPEVGIVRTEVGGCLGTLIGPSAVISSAACYSPAGFFTDTLGSTIINCRPVGSFELGEPRLLIDELMICRIFGPPRDIFARIADEAPDTGLVVSQLCGAPLGHLWGATLTLELSYQHLELPQPRLDWRASGEACPGDQGAPIFAQPTNLSDQLELFGVLGSTYPSRRELGFAAIDIDKRSSALLQSASELGLQICGIHESAENCSRSREASSLETQPLVLETVSVRYSESDTIIGTATQLCTFLTPAYLEVLQAIFDPDASGKLTAELMDQGNIQLPICPNDIDFEFRTVEPGDSPLKYYERERGKFGFPNGGLADGSQPGTFMAAFWALNPTYGGGLRPGETIKLPKIIDSVIGTDNDTLRAEPRITLIGAEPASSGAGQCRDSIPDHRWLTPFNTDPLVYPFDVASLVEILHNNKPKRRRDISAKIMVADTGVFVPPDGLAVPDYFRAISHDPQMALPSENASSARDVSHGTQVASLALGGPILARIWSITGDRSIEVQSLRILNPSNTGDFVAQPASINDLDAEGAQVVNLSVAGPNREEFRAIAEARDNKFPLFVAAAGNGGTRFTDEGSELFPAGLGGEQRRNLIVVAMQDGPRPMLHPLSSFDEVRADIAAPGCSVQVIGWNDGEYQIEQATGTSIAAPIVSFAAALIYNEGVDDTAQKLKRRLLISANLSPVRVPDDSLHIGTTIRDGRRLDILKALMLHEDILEIPGVFEGDPNQVLQGEVEFETAGRQLGSDERLRFDGCNDNPNLFIPVSFIYKLWPFVQDGQKKIRIYYRKNGEEPAFEDTIFETATCDVPENIAVSIDTGGGSEKHSELGSIVDYVAASRRN